MSTDHVILNYAVQPNELQCTACGWSMVLPLPASMNFIGKLLKTVVSEHRKCAKAKKEGA